MESNEIDQMIDDNQRGQNTQPIGQSNGNDVSGTYPRTDDDDDVETVEDDVRREWAPDNEVPEPIQRTQPSSDENEDDTDDEDRNDRDQNYQTPGMDYGKDGVQRETNTDNFHGRHPISDEDDNDSEDYDRADRDQQQNLQTPQSSHTEDEQENAADEIRTDFAGDGFRREANLDNNGQGRQAFSDENRGDTEEDYRADRDQRQDYQTPLSDHNPLSDENANEANEDIPRSTDNPNEIPDRDQNRGFRSPVSDDEETV